MGSGLTAISAALGYLLGSISFARLVAWRIDPSAQIDRIDVRLSSGAVFTSDSVSATAVRVHVGTRFGVLTGVLDMLKVAIPTLIVRRLKPRQQAHLVVAASGLVGHDYPIFHRFKGGRGESPIYGTMLALDPAGVLATTVAGVLVGFLSGNLLILRWAGMVLLVPWAAVIRRNGPLATYALFANGVFFWSMRPELAQYAAMLNDDADPSQEEIAAEYGMGARLGRALDRYGVPGLVGRLRRRNR